MVINDITNPGNAGYLSIHGNIPHENARGGNLQGGNLQGGNALDVRQAYILLASTKKCADILLQQNIFRERTREVQRPAPYFARFAR